VLFRSLCSLAGRGLAAGAASALALTLFNAAQPSLSGDKEIHPAPSRTFPFGRRNDLGVAGDWNGNNTRTRGCCARAAAGT
jgi:hypothetical protein